MKENIEIIEFEHKVTSAGKPYARLKTNKGWISVFDEKLIKTAKDSVGKVVEADLIQSGNFLNLRGIKPSNGECVPVEKIAASPENKQRSINVSYAKDIFCAIISKDSKDFSDEIMRKCCDLVKIAEEEFAK